MLSINNNHLRKGVQYLDIETYIADRVDDQIKWYSDESSKAKTMYKRYQTIEIILAASIPLLSGYTDFKFIPFIVGVCGAIIAVIEAITKLNKYHENWIQYRCTSEMLKHQKHLYTTKSSPYNDLDETIENVFIRNIESIISSENNQWKSINAKQKSE